MSSVHAIRNYLLFLRKECHLSVSFHTASYDRLIMPTELSVFNIHENNYCVYMKTCPGTWNHCLRQQMKVQRKVQEGAFSGVCYAGVQEFVYPIRDGQNIVGFISVSGYGIPDHSSYLDRISSEYGFSREKLEAVYNTLKAAPSSRDRIDTLLLPLCDMLELAYQKQTVDCPMPQDFADQVIRYIAQNHRNDLTSQQICSHFSCSRSYMSRAFNKRTGMSIPQYITKLRMEDASFLLEHSDLSVTQVALSVGFSDSNYFTNLFKEHTQLTPSAYRKLHGNKP